MMQFGQYKHYVEINHVRGWFEETGWIWFCSTIMWRTK